MAANSRTEVQMTLVHGADAVYTPGLILDPRNLLLAGLRSEHASHLK